MAKESPPPIRRPRYSEDKKWKCPLCPQSYYDSRTLRRHIVGKHPEGKDLPEVSIATKSKEDLRDQCPHCRKPFVELRKHIKICLEDPKRITENPQEISSESPHLTTFSNLQFMEFYKARLSKSGLSAKAVSCYISALKVHTIHMSCDRHLDVFCPSQPASQPPRNDSLFSGSKFKFQINYIGFSPLLFLFFFNFEKTWLAGQEASGYASPLH